MAVIKQEMARVDIDILGISELKCTEIGEFNSDDSCIYCCVHPVIVALGILSCGLQTVSCRV